VAPKIVLFVADIAVLEIGFQVENYFALGTAPVAVLGKVLRIARETLVDVDVLGAETVDLLYSRSSFVGHPLGTIFLVGSIDPASDCLELELPFALAPSGIVLGENFRNQYSGCLLVDIQNSTRLGAALVLDFVEKIVVGWVFGVVWSGFDFGVRGKKFDSGCWLVFGLELNSERLAPAPGLKSALGFSFGSLGLLTNPPLQTDWKDRPC